MSVSGLPFTASLDLGTVRDRVVEVSVAPGPAERAAIARWLGIEALDSLKAVIQILRSNADEYAYRGHFEADVVQACVITLAPVPAHRPNPRPSPLADGNPGKRKAKKPAFPRLLRALAWERGFGLPPHPVFRLLAADLRELFKKGLPPWRFQNEKPRRRSAICAART